MDEGPSRGSFLTVTSVVERQSYHRSGGSRRAGTSEEALALLGDVCLTKGAMPVFRDLHRSGGREEFERHDSQDYLVMHSPALPALRHACLSGH